MHDLTAMLDRNETLRALDRIAGYHSPILSMYVPTRCTPEDLDAALIRARATLRQLAVPDDIGRRALEAIGERVGPGTLALFVRPTGEVDELALAVELPIANGDTLEARWGAAYTVPLRMALSGAGRYLAAHIADHHLRLFDVFLEACEELPAVHGEAPYEGEADASKQVHPAYTPSRGGAHKDLADRHLRELRRRFYRRAGQRVASIVRDRRIDAVLLLGTARDVQAFADELPPPVAARVSDRLPSLANPGCSSREVLARILPVIRAHEEERKAALLAALDQRGLYGLAPCLRALRHGRLETIVASWRRHDEVVAPADVGYPPAPAGDEDAEEPAPLGEVLTHLARRHGADVVFLTGPDDDRLQREMTGVAGLPRW